MSESQRERIGGEKKQPAAFDEGVEEKEDKRKGSETHTDEHMDKIDKALGELIDIVARGPEAKKEALRIAIEQIRMIGEQMRQIRDMRNLNELKREMIRQWKELEKAAGGDHELLEQIQDWGRRFNEGKIVYYDLVGEVKDVLWQSAQDGQKAWNEFHIEIGKFGELNSQDKWKIDEHLGHSDFINLERRTSFLDKFFVSINDPSGGFEKDIDFKEAARALSGMSYVIQILVRYAHTPQFSTEAGGSQRPIDKNPELAENITKLSELATILGKIVGEIASTYKMIKKIRDTQFFPLYNEHEEIKVA